MESNIIRWLNNSNDTILDSILIISRNNYFISRPNLIELASKNSSYYRKIRRGLSNDQFDMLKKQVLNVLPSYYINNNSGDNEILYSYNIVKENNLKFESAIRQLIENNIILNQNHFIKVNNENNHNNKDLINSINNNNYNPNSSNSDNVTIELGKLQKIQQDVYAPGPGKSVVKSNSPTDTTVIELVPNNHKEYFNKNIPLEIAKLMDAKEYHSFISKLNNTYSGNLFISLYIFFYIASLIIVAFVGFYTSNEDGVFVTCVIFSVITVCFLIFFIVYSYRIKYYWISSIIRKKNLKLIKNNSPLEFVLVYKQVKYPQTKDRITLQILVIRPDYVGIDNSSINNNFSTNNFNNNNNNNNNNNKNNNNNNNNNPSINNNNESGLREDIMNETININLNKLNNIDNV